MTIREQLNQEKRRLIAGASAFVAANAICICNSDLSRYPWMPIVCVCVISVLFLAILFKLRYGFRCLECGVPWRSSALGQGSPFSIDKRIRFCPYCGQDIDAEVTPMPLKEDADFD